MREILLDDILDVPYRLAPNHFLDFFHVQGFVLYQSIGELFRVNREDMMSIDVLEMGWEGLLGGAPSLLTSTAQTPGLSQLSASYEYRHISLSPEKKSKHDTYDRTSFSTSSLFLGLIGSSRPSHTGPSFSEYP